MVSGVKLDGKLKLLSFMKVLWLCSVPFDLQNQLGYQSIKELGNRPDVSDWRVERKGGTDERYRQQLSKHVTISCKSILGLKCTRKWTTPVWSCLFTALVTPCIRIAVWNYEIVLVDEIIYIYFFFDNAITQPLVPSRLQHLFLIPCKRWVHAWNPTDPSSSEN